MSSISEVFERTVIRKDFGQPLVRAVNRFYNEFLTRHNSLVDHAGFFGSGYLGIHTIKWLPSDTITFWQDVVDGEIEESRSQLWALPTVIPEGKTAGDRVVGSDPTNLVMVWLVHKVLTNKTLPERVARRCAAEIMSIMYFKFLTSLMGEYFSYGADPQLAIRCYEAMNYKFDLKVYKTWGRLIEARANGFVVPRSNHWKTFMDGKPDEKMIYVATDMQTRVRVGLLAITSLYYKVREENDRVVSVSAMFESEDGAEVRDVQRPISGYMRYLQDIIIDRNGFIRAELVKVVLEMNPSADAAATVATLEYISATYGGNKGVKLRRYVDEVLEWAFALTMGKGIVLTNLVAVADAVKGMLNASLNKSPELMHIRKFGDQLVRDATDKKSSVVVSGERTAVVLYLILRSLTENYFKRH